MKRALAVLSAAVMLTVPGGVLAHEGHAHKVMGTVAAIDATHVEVTTADGKKESFPLTKETRYVKGKAAAAAADVKVGARVVLSVVEKEGKSSVSEVAMAEAGKPDQHQGKH